MAKLIKKGHTQSAVTETDAIGAPTAAIIDRDTYEARSEAQQIRERAQKAAEEIVAEAHAQAEAIAEQAQSEAAQMKEEAKAQGYAEGRQAGADELSAAAMQTAMRMQEIEAQLLPQLRELAIGIARKILGKELEFHPEAVVQIVKQALSEKARQRREVSLRVHPDDLQMLREHKADLLDVLNRTKEIGIREDPSVQRHGVIIETDAGTIDAQLETQLAVFERVLAEVR